MSKLIKMAIRYRYHKCTWNDFISVVKLTIVAAGKKPTEEKIRSVSVRAMKLAKQKIGG